MYDLTLAAMAVILLSLGVMLVIKVRRISAWSPPEDEPEGKQNIRIPRELLELTIDHGSTGEIELPDDQPPAESERTQTGG